MKKSVCNLVFSAVLLFSSLSAAAGIEVDGWVRQSIPGSSVGAAYLTIKNTTANAIDLNGVSSSASRSVMIHATRIVNGRSTMRHLSSYLVPANSSKTMMPGEVHLMLMGVETLNIGDEVSFTLSFNDRDEIIVNLPVRKT